MMYRRLLLATCLVTLGGGSALAADFSTVTKEQAAAGVPSVDRSVDPCQNFYQYACNAWQVANPIPADQSRWLSFSVLSQDNLALLRTTLEQAVKAPTPTTTKIADYYAACMNEARADQLGAQPLQPTLQRLAALSDKQALATEVARLHTAGVGALFQFGSVQDFKNVTRMIAYVDQGGLGLPDRDFYTKDDAKSEETRQAYVRHVARMFGLLGDTPDRAQARAKAVMTLETALAKASLTLAERNDPQKIYHKLPKAELAKLAPDFDWAAYFTATGAPDFVDLNITHPDFFKAVSQIVAGTGLDDIRSYLTWQTVNGAADWLSTPFVQADFDFYGKTLRGAQEIRPRWKRCVAAVDGALGEDLGRYYIEKAFGPQAKGKTLDLVAKIAESLHQDIKSLEWMTAQTKQRAHAKLDAVANKIGYPDKWRDYSPLQVRADDLYGNVARSNAFETARQLAKIGTATDRSEWYMTPPTVNAYYDPTQNDINFPAGILQKPFYHPEFDDAFNYGGIGAVIGHEIIHGFDDQGRQFDKDGNLNDWWSAADAKAYVERAQCFVQQYAQFQPVPGVNLNGEATLGENIADNGGARIALAALRKAAAGKDSKVGGYTLEQRFFLGYAQTWCGNVRPEAARSQALSDVHADHESRVNGVVANMPEFAAAFNCKAGQPMVRGDKACRIW